MKITYVYIALFVFVIGGIILVKMNTEKASNDPASLTSMDVFAQCLSDAGAKFYGAYWCPHCQNQKAMFGKAAKKLPYIECSTPDGQAQLPICKDAGVTGYPMWSFADGSTINGEAELDVLAEKTACVLPQ